LLAQAPRPAGLRVTRDVDMTSAVKATDWSCSHRRCLHGFQVSSRGGASNADG
jgi:hypothetical protein